MKKLLLVLFFVLFPVSVGATGSLMLSNSWVNFNYTQGDSFNQMLYQSSLTIFNPSTDVLNFTISVPNQPSWLNTGYNTQAIPVQPGSSAGLGVSVDPTKLSPGVYTYDVGLLGDFNNPTSIRVTLTVSGATKSPTASLWADSTTLYSSGESGVTTLHWTSTNADYCMFEKQKYGPSGSAQINIGLVPVSTYYVNCFGQGGSALSNPVTIYLKMNDNKSGNDPYNDSNYFQISSVPLSANERTVTYTYPDNPCGSLMTQYVATGSVKAGNGPVYNLASQQCSTGNQVPDTSTFRTYSCQNSQLGSSVVGRATFAFQCKAPGSTDTTWKPSTPTPTTTLSDSQREQMILQLQQMIQQLLQQLIQLLQKQQAALIMSGSL